MQPTLHEYSIYSCHLKLVEQDAIAYPLALCGPLNAKHIWCSKIPLNAGKSC